MKKNNITTLQRTIAYTLLISQLLTSCGVKQTIVPDIRSSRTTPDTYPLTPQGGTPAQQFPISTTTVDGKEMVFDYKEEKGLIASYKQVASSQEFTPIEEYPALKDIDGKQIFLSKISMQEALFFPQEGKWDVSTAGELKYLGMRGRGGVTDIVTGTIGNLLTIGAAERSAARTMVRGRLAANAVINKAGSEARLTIVQAESSALNVIGRAEGSARNVISHAEGSARNVISHAEGSARNVITHAEGSGHRLLDHGQGILIRTEDGVVRVLDRTSDIVDQTREAGLEFTRETERASAELIDQVGGRGDLLFSRSEQTSARINKQLERTLKAVIRSVSNLGEQMNPVNYFLNFFTGLRRVLFETEEDKTYTLMIKNIHEKMDYFAQTNGRDPQENEEFIDSIRNLLKGIDQNIASLPSRQKLYIYLKGTITKHVACSSMEMAQMLHMVLLEHIEGSYTPEEIAQFQTTSLNELFENRVDLASLEQEPIIKIRIDQTFGMLGNVSGKNTRQNDKLVETITNLLHYIDDNIQMNRLKPALYNQVAKNIQNHIGHSSKKFADLLTIFVADYLVQNYEQAELDSFSNPLRTNLKTYTSQLYTVQTPYYEYSMQETIRRKYINVLMYLLTMRKLDPNTTDEAEEPPIIVAIQKQDLEAFKLLLGSPTLQLQNGDKATHDALYVALRTYESTPNEVTACIFKSVLRISQDTQNEQEQTNLAQTFNHILHHNEIHLVDILLDEKLGLSTQREGLQFLYAALSEANLPLVNLLFEKGVSIAPQAKMEQAILALLQAKDIEKESVLTNIINVLKNKGVSLDKNYPDKNILDLAIAHNNYIVWRVIQFMQRSGNSFAKSHESVMRNEQVSKAFKKDLLSMNGSMLQYVSDEIKKDPEMILTALRSKSDYVGILQFVAPELQSSQIFVLEALKKDGMALQYADASLRSDREIVLAAVQKNGISALQYADVSLRSDNEVVLAAVLRVREMYR